MSVTQEPPGDWLALGSQQAEPERGDAQRERRHAHVKQHDEAIRLGEAAPGRGQEETGGHQQGCRPDAVASQQRRQAAQLSAISQQLTDQGEGSSNPFVYTGSREGVERRVLYVQIVFFTHRTLRNV